MVPPTQFFESHTSHGSKCESPRELVAGDRALSSMNTSQHFRGMLGYPHIWVGNSCLLHLMWGSIHWPICYLFLNALVVCWRVTYIDKTHHLSQRSTWNIYDLNTLVVCWSYPCRVIENISCLDRKFNQPSWKAPSTLWWYAGNTQSSDEFLRQWRVTTNLIYRM